MGMTIDEAIDFLEESKYSPYEASSSCTIDLAIETMRKYQKIKEIYDNWNVDFGVETHRAMSKIGKVLEDE